MHYLKKILVLFIVLFILSSVNVYAQSMSKYGYPENFHPSKSQTYNHNVKLFPHRINPAILSVNNMFGMSYSDLGLNYGEYNDGSVPTINNKYLDTDNGFTNGFLIKLTNTYNNWYSNVNFSYNTGNVTYSGYIPEPTGTVSNMQFLLTPLTFTDESSKIYNMNWKIGYMIPITNKFVITPYGEIGWHLWKRGDNTSQYAHYSNWLAMAGILAQYAITPKFVSDIDFSYGTTFDAKTTENNNMSGGAIYCQNNNLATCIPFVNENTVTFNLGSKAIYSLSAGLDYRFYRKFHIFANVNYERFKYGKSSTIYLAPTSVYNNSVFEYFLPNSATEPNSVTNEIIYSIGIGYSF